ncbi:MAG: hypothetical protein HKN70_06670 [Gammaproteobacteria bacterium]|nr:hypothetical protein [Gammaproteobacteria bacterium]
MKLLYSIGALVVIALSMSSIGVSAAPAQQHKEHRAQPTQKAGTVKNRGNVERRRVTYFHPVGHRVTALPKRYTRVTVGRKDYFYHGGHFYRPNRSAYMIVAAPFGARVRSLPAGYVSFGIGTRRYFYVNTTFYLWDRDRDEYVVVEEPDGAAEAMATAEPEEPTRLFVYPNAGQSEEQTGRDRYECHLWAAEESGYDPTYPDQPLAHLTDYNRAIGACLEGRGYTVK